MLGIIWIILRLLGAMGAVSYAVGHEAVATGGDLGLQQYFNIAVWVVGAVGAFFATGGGVIDKLKALWAWVKQNPFPKLSKATRMRNMVLQTVSEFKHLPVDLRLALVKASDDFCCCAAFHDGDAPTTTVGKEAIRQAEASR